MHYIETRKTLNLAHTQSKHAVKLSSAFALIRSIALDYARNVQQLNFNAMRINQLKFFEALHSAVIAYERFYIHNSHFYTNAEKDEMQDKLLLLKNIVEEMRPWTSEDVIIDEMPF